MRTLLAVLTLAGLSAATPVPKVVKKKVTEAWGAEVEGLQAGLRMSGEGTVEGGQTAELQVVVRNVGKKSVAVQFDEQNGNVDLYGRLKDGKIDLHLIVRDPVRGERPKLREELLEPGAELVRWKVVLSTAALADWVWKDLPPADAQAGKWRVELKEVIGEVRNHAAPDRPVFDGLGTGTLEVTVK
jgi:hypothetical protein